MSKRFLGRVVLPVFASAASLWLFVACGSSSDTVAPVAGTCDTQQVAVESATFSALYTNVFGPQCGACHGSGTDTGTQGGPDMRSADAFYEGLVGKKGNDFPDWDTLQKNREGCLAYDLIAPGAANNSLVTAVLDSSTSLANCTVKYHREAPQSVCITSGNLAKFKDWVNQGAKR